MRLFVTFSKKSLAIALAVLVVGVIITGEVYSVKCSRIDGSTNAKRVEYLRSLNINVDDTNVTQKETVIPTDFGDVYTEYNKLQKKAGFDLSRYKGKSVTVYTYFLNETREVHLIVHEGAVIGGDIADVRLDGEMKPLVSTK